MGQPRALFVRDFKAKTEVKAPVRTGREVRSPDTKGRAYELVKAIEGRKYVQKMDFVPYYKPSDDLWGSATGLDERPSIEDLAAICNTRMGCAWTATMGVSGDVVRNWHVFADPDSLKERRNDDTKAALKYAKGPSDLKNQCQQWMRYVLGMGTSWLLKYWNADDIKNMQATPNLRKPPKKFRAFSPRYMQPINTDKSNELNYQEEVWKFGGGEIRYAYDIHQDRVEVLSLYPEEGHWRGLSVVEPVWVPLMGYFNGFIYLTRGLRQWGDAVPAMFSGEGLPKEGEITSMLDLMDEYQMNYKWALGKDDRLEFKQTQIGKGLDTAFEIYKEELSSAWRIPLNQLFGRSEGGGLAGAGALVSKEDYLQEISNKQMAMSDNLMKIYTEAGFDVESYEILWNIAIKKTDEQRLKEEAMEIQVKTAKEQWRQAKLQTEMLKLQVEAARWQGIMPDQEGGEEGGEQGGETEEGGEEAEGEDEDSFEIPELSDMTGPQKVRAVQFWKSIQIDNRINREVNENG